MRYILLLFAISLSIYSQDNDTVNYNVKGHGEPIYVLHGGPMFNSLYMKSALEDLDKDFKMVFIDLPGRGKSSFYSDSSIGFKYDIKSIEFVRKMLNDKVISLLGHSFGGFVSLGYTNEYPNNVNKVICVSSPLFINDSIFNNQAMELYQYLSIDTIKTKHENLNLLIHLNIYDTNMVKTSFIKDFENSMVYHDTSEVFSQVAEHYNMTLKNQWNEIFHTDLLHIGYSYFQANSNKKFLFLFGEDDELAFINKWKDKINELSNVRYKIYQNSKHLPFYENNTEFIKDVKSFLKQ